MGNKVSLEEELINLRIVSKQMIRSSKKCEKNEKAALEKLKKVSRTSLLTHDECTGYFVPYTNPWRCLHSKFL
jgi:hypothetical protein